MHNTTFSFSDLPSINTIDLDAIVGGEGWGEWVGKYAGATVGGGLGALGGTAAGTAVGGPVGGVVGGGAGAAARSLSRIERERRRRGVARAAATLGVPPRTRSHRRCDPGNLLCCELPSQAIVVLARPVGPGSPQRLARSPRRTRSRARRAVTRARRNDRHGRRGLIE
jgi:hypothetical protein